MLGTGGQGDPTPTLNGYFFTLIRQYPGGKLSTSGGKRNYDQ